MVDAIMQDQKRVLPSAVLCEGEYGLKNVIVGVPVKLGRGGAEQVIEYELTADERAQWRERTLARIAARAGIDRRAEGPPATSRSNEAFPLLRDVMEG